MLMCDVTPHLHCFLLSQLCVTWLADVQSFRLHWYGGGVSIMASMQVRARSQVTAYFQFRRTPVWYCLADLLARPLLYGRTFEVAMTVEQKGLNISPWWVTAALGLCLAIQPILNSQSQRSHRSRLRVVMLCFSLITVWMVTVTSQFP